MANERISMASTQQTSTSSQYSENIRIKPFEWDDWNAMWQLRAYQLAEAGIIIDVQPSLPDFSIPYDEENTSYPEIDMDRIDQAYLQGRGNFWIAWTGDQPLGHVGAQDFGSYIELRRMYVRKEFRRGGIGSLLVKALIDHCNAQKAEKIELWTAGDDLGRILYQKFGFREVTPMGDEFDYAKRAGEEIRMRLELCNK